MSQDDLPISVNVIRQTYKYFDVFFKDNGAAVNLTGLTKRLQIRNRYDDSLIKDLNDTDIEGSRLVAYDAEGRVRAILTTEDTENIPEEIYKFDVAASNGDGEVVRRSATKYIKFTDNTTDVNL